VQLQQLLLIIRSLSVNHLLKKHFHNFLGTPVFLYMQIVNPTIVTKLQFIRIKTELAYIDR